MTIHPEVRPYVMQAAMKIKAKNPNVDNKTLMEMARDCTYANHMADSSLFRATYMTNADIDDLDDYPESEWIWL